VGASPAVFLVQKKEKKELQEDNRALHEENRMIINRVSRMEDEWAELKHNMSAG
jgi:uncharacterized protein (UPF0335 family)